MKKVALSVSLSAMILFAAAADAQVNLRYKNRVGEKLKTTISQKMDMQIKTPFAPAPIGMTTVMEIQTVQETLKILDNGSARVRSKNVSMKMTLESPATGKIVVDSTKKEGREGLAKQIGAAVDASSGVESEFTLSPTGQISDFEIDEEAMKKVLASAGPAAAQMKDLFSKEGLQARAQGAIPAFPKKLRSGDNWKQESNAAGMKTITNYVYKGEKVIDGRALHEFDAEVEMEVGAGPIPGMKMEIEKQRSSGKMYFDAAAGRFVSSDLTADMSLSAVAGGQKIGQNISMDIKTVVEPVE